MASPVQKGTSVELGFGSWTVAATQMESVEAEQTGDIDEIRDDDNAMATKIITNRGVRRTFTFKCKTTSSILSTLDGYVRGDTFTVNSIGHMIDSIRIRRSRLAVEVTITGVKEASMTYT